MVPLRLKLHVVLDVTQQQNAELKFNSQEDHIFWVESLLGLNPVLTLGFGPFFLKFVRPLAGQACQTNNVYSSTRSHCSHVLSYKMMLLQVYSKLGMLMSTLCKHITTHSTTVQMK